MWKKIFLLTSSALLTIGSICYAQDGLLDASFNPGTGANSTIRCTVLQNDGKVIIGGDFTTYNGAAATRIARLHPDGSLDVSFNPGTGANNMVRAIALQSDGKILVSGSFTSFNGAAQNCLTRLNSDGSLDGTFNIGSGPSFSFGPSITNIVVQNDGKILISGLFTAFNGANCKSLARLNSDGSIDNTFSLSAGPSTNIWAIALQADNKIVIGGTFNTYQGVANNCIARLMPDGTLDNTFISGTGFNNWIFSIVIQSDQKILVGGDFTTYNGVAASRIIRLNTNGTIDPAFNSSGTGANSSVRTIALKNDAKIVLGGLFTTYNTMTPNYICQLNTDGTFDASFNPSGSYASANVFALAIQPDNKIILGGNFTGYNGTSRNRIARLTPPIPLGTGFQSISAQAQNDNEVLVSWKITTQENTSSVFHVEHSTNGSEWNSIGQVASLTNDNSGEYHFLHLSPKESDINYYRVKRIQPNFEELLSDVVAVQLRLTGNHYTLYPNPAHDFIEIGGELPENTLITILDIAGNVTQIFSTDVVNKVPLIQVSELKNGCYFLVITTTTEQQCFKFNVQH